MFRATLAIIAAGLILAACSDFPDLEGTVSNRARNAPYPDLLPMQQLLNASGATTSGPASGLMTATAIAGRVAGLKARAAALRGPVLDPPTRQRLQRAVLRHN